MAQVRANHPPPWPVKPTRGYSDAGMEASTAAEKPHHGIARPPAHWFNTNCSDSTHYSIEFLPDNRFYAPNCRNRRPDSLDRSAGGWPFTYKTELLGSSHGDDLAANRTWPMERYARFHRTSGTHGRPLVVLDTAEDWQWWLDCWQYVLDAAEVTPSDRVLMAFSFGPFIGFWSVTMRSRPAGCLLVPTGGVSTLGRLEMARTSRATVSVAHRATRCIWPKWRADNKIDPAGTGHPANDRGRRTWRLGAGRAERHRIDLGSPACSIIAGRRKSDHGDTATNRRRHAVIESQIHRRVSFGRDRHSGGRRGTGRTGAHDARAAAGQPGDPLSHRRFGPPARGMAKGRADSCDWKVAFWAAPTTCWWSAA